jgi:hypothetical protein
VIFARQPRAALEARGALRVPGAGGCIEEIGPGVYLLKVRHGSGQPDETQETAEELEHALAEQEPMAALTDSGDLFRWVEGQRIKLSFAHDPLFAVSMSGARGLPHQIEAVYWHMLPQPRLRFCARR